RQLLGQRLWRWLLRVTVYRQFVGGQTPSEVTATLSRLRSMGLSSIVALPMELDVGQEQ
ncbi:HYPDH dehydrogenase, partial [Rhinopomastus cyanomelas]|nr:HYPDH dehydrogenase [Rhinopomastus cyanomelas]